MGRHVAAPTIRVTSLRDAMEAVMEAVIDAAGCPRTVLVAAVHVLHASALDELLSYQALPGRSRCRWAVANDSSLKQLVLTDNLLVAIGAAVLPILVGNPTDNSALEELRSCVVRVQDCATTLGGSFQTEVEEVLDSLLDHLHAADLHPDDVTEAWLAENAQALIGMIINFRTRHLTLAVRDF